MLLLIGQCVGGEPQKYLKSLDQERGTVIDAIDNPDAGFDSQGLNELRAMLRGA